MHQQQGLLPEAPSILNPEDPDLWPEAPLRDLMYRADSLRERHTGNRVRTCALVSAKSGNCSQDCAFCAQSGHNQAKAPVHELLPREELVRSAIAAAEAGAVNVSLVSSGRCPGQRELETICEAVHEIRQRTGISVCASLGTLSLETACQLRLAGVETYHHNLETAPSYYPEICSTHPQLERERTVRVAREAGMRICSGGIFGLGESWPQRVELARTLHALNADSIPINFLNPVPGTPLENKQPLDPTEALRCVALMRCINPDRDIILCGGRERTLRSLQSQIFPAGANGLIVGHYLTTVGDAAESDMAMIRDSCLEPL